MPTVQDLVRIAAAGGGFELEAGSYAVSDLVRIAAAASAKRPLLIVKDAGGLIVSDLVRVAAAGQGAVHFQF